MCQIFLINLDRSSVRLSVVNKNLAALCIFYQWIRGFDAGREDVNICKVNLADFNVLTAAGLFGAVKRDATKVICNLFKLFLIAEKNLELLFKMMLCLKIFLIKVSLN